MIEMDDINPDFTPMVWNIAFTSSRDTGWWRFLSPAWCRHVLAFGYVPASDSWVVVQNSAARTIILSVPDGPFGGWLQQLLLEKPVILRHRVKEGKPHAHRIGVWCSTMVARLIGVPGGAWRPLALYRSLLRDGAIPAFGTAPHGEARNESRRAEGRPGDRSAA